MKLTPNKLRKLKKFSTRLLKLEKKIVKESIKIDKKILKKINNKNDFLDDYEIRATVDFYIKGIPESIATIRENFEKISIDKERFDFMFLSNRNHNKFFYSNQKKHPMYYDFHCWWFHCLYDHEHISWKRILEIKDIHVTLNVFHHYLKNKMEL